MQLKLVLAFGGEFGSRIQSGTIVKWHKAEGQEVRYGDPLFDMHVRSVLSHQGVVEQQNLVHLYNNRLWQAPGGTADRGALEERSSERMVIEEIGTGQMVSVRRSFLVRVHSSDSGILRKHCAKDGEHREAGDLLALLTTSPGESVDETSEALNRTAKFRALVEGRLLVTGETEETTRKFTNRIQHRSLRGADSIIIWSESEMEKRIGIYSATGLPMLPMFAAAPMIYRNLQGRCCILREAWLELRSDLLLEYLNNYPSRQIDEVSNKLNLSTWWLQPQWLEKTFRVEGPQGEEEFPKTVVVLSIAADATASCFQHKDYGILVPSEAVYKLDTEGLEWFQRNFTPMGTLSGDGFRKSFGGLIQVLQRQTGAHILVLNAFSSAPRSLDHNYQFLDDHPGGRQLELNLALAELSRDLDFSILDVDRILKRSGIADQLDWHSAAPDTYGAIASEAYCILQDRGLVC